MKEQEKGHDTESRSGSPSPTAEAGKSTSSLLHQATARLFVMTDGRAIYHETAPMKTWSVPCAVRRISIFDALEVSGVPARNGDGDGLVARPARLVPPRA
ncbi:hypothetical protein [Leifsonia sp. P73]|uniref:hypothetical protein n=1 Tax=Leifsonia sp. P73 TaxID=3423959 RepID=UPI003DA247B4